MKCNKKIPKLNCVSVLKQIVILLILLYCVAVFTYRDSRCPQTA